MEKYKHVPHPWGASACPILSSFRNLPDFRFENKSNLLKYVPNYNIHKFLQEVASPFFMWLELPQKCPDIGLYLSCGERGCAAFECRDEVLAEDIPAGGVMRNFLDGVLGVVGVAHEPEVLPDDLFASAGAQAGEIGVECAPALDTCGVFIAEGNVCAVEGVRDDDFGFRADADTACGEKLGCVDFEGLARVGQVSPAGGKVVVGFSHGCDECTAAWMQPGEGLVECVGLICPEECVDGRKLLFDDGRRRFVVVSLRNGFCLADFFAGKVRALRVALLRDDVILERFLVWLNP